MGTVSSRGEMHCPLCCDLALFSEMIDLLRELKLSFMLNIWRNICHLWLNTSLEKAKTQVIFKQVVVKPLLKKLHSKLLVILVTTFKAAVGAKPVVCEFYILSIPNSHGFSLMYAVEGGIV